MSGGVGGSRRAITVTRPDLFRFFLADEAALTAEAR
jgi:hypothetical protein